MSLPLPQVLDLSGIPDPRRPRWLRNAAHVQERWTPDGEPSRRFCGLGTGHLLNIYRIVCLHSASYKRAMLDELWSAYMHVQGEMATYYIERDLAAAEDLDDAAFVAPLIKLIERTLAARRYLTVREGRVQRYHTNSPTSNYIEQEA